MIMIICVVCNVNVWCVAVGPCPAAGCVLSAQRSAAQCGSSVVAVLYIMLIY